MQAYISLQFASLDYIMISTSYGTGYSDTPDYLIPGQADRALHIISRVERSSFRESPYGPSATGRLRPIYPGD